MAIRRVVTNKGKRTPGIDGELWDSPSRGKPKTLDLLQVQSFKIVRHVKVRAEANPYDKAWQDYFRKRTAGTAIALQAAWS